MKKILLLAFIFVGCILHPEEEKKESRKITIDCRDKNIYPDIKPPGAPEDTLIGCQLGED